MNDKRWKEQTNINFFVVQVKTGSEYSFLQRANRELDSDTQKLYWLRRALRIRKKGVWRNSLAPIFSGYLFLQSQSVSPELYRSFKRIPGFHRFLKDNQNITQVSRTDKNILLHFLSYGEVIGRSKVVFDRDSRIRVLSGPLKNLNGTIVKVDKRKGRVKVRLHMYKDSFLIDFGFDCLEPAKEK